MTSNGPATSAICVLGPVSLQAGEESVSVGGPLPRRLLSALLVNRDGVVSRDRLVEVLWGDDPPDAALSSLHSSVSRLRRLLPVSARLDTVAPGYRLWVDAGALDVDRFENGLDDALDRAAGDPQAALAGLEGALACWKGDAYAEFHDEWWARGEAARLEERRMHAREARAEVLLTLGRDEAAVGEARTITANHPSRERAWRVLVLGLHRGGRQSEALRAAHEYRARLREESGLDPSQDFVLLEYDVANDAPGLRVPPPPIVVTPPAKTRVGNLSAAVTSLVGRGDELERLVAELGNRRLVTLTGTGGVGKTRLATEAAWRAADAFPDGVWVCELAPVAAPDAVAHAVATTLAVRLQAGLSVLDSVVDALAGRRALIVLDNCEHVLDAAARLGEGITRGCPTVSVLATSRAPLGVAGERVWAVRPLPAATEGVELFSDRAGDADAAPAAAAPDRGDEALVAAICERLDGLPLAIELAAAHVRSMTLADLADRLDDRFRLLGGGRRGDRDHHHTLRATVEWSYQLLSDEERLLFDRLAVFAGSFEAAAAGAVCSDDRLDGREVGDLLIGLVDKSMVVADVGGLHARYGLLETLRQFGEERLDEQDELAGFRDRHLDHYAQLAERTRQRYEGDAHVQAAAVFRVEWDNLRAAMQRAIALGDAAQASQILRALHFFAHHDQRHEIGDWADQFIRSAEATTMIYGVAGSQAGWRGDHVQELRLAETGLLLAPTATSPGVWLCWIDIEMSHWYSGRADEASAASRALHDAVDPQREPFAAGMAAAGATAQACYAADRGAAVRYLDRLQQVAAALHNPAMDIVLHWASSIVERTNGRFGAALHHLQLAVALGKETGNRWFDGMGRLSLAIVAMASDPATAPVAFDDALTHLYANRDWANTWIAIEALAVHWTKTGRTESAATLLGHLQARNIHPATVWRQQREDAVAALRETPEAQSWMARGGTLDRDQLVHYALDQLVDAADTVP